MGSLPARIEWPMRLFFRQTETFTQASPNRRIGMTFYTEEIGP